MCREERYKGSDFLRVGEERAEDVILGKKDRAGCPRFVHPGSATWRLSRLRLGLLREREHD
jgi:hypothetical protein